MADSGAKTGEGASRPIDAWLVHDDGDSGINLDAWRALLESPSNRGGLARVTLEVYKGRKGWTPLRTLVCSDAKGERIESPSQQPELDVERLLVSLREAVEDNHERYRYKRYTLRLWNVRKKGGPLEKGEEKNLVMDSDGEGSAEDPFNVRMGEQYLKFGALQQATIRELLGGLDMVVRAAFSAQIGAMDHQNKAMALFREAQEFDAASRAKPSPGDVNRRIETVVRGLQRPLEIFADHTGRALGMWVEQKVTGTAPSGAAGHAPNAGEPAEPTEEQAKVRDLFAGLSPEQKDQLRDGLGAEVFSDVVSIIHAGPEVWAQHRGNVARLLQANVMLLMKVLTPEQLAVLRGL